MVRVVEGATIHLTKPFWAASGIVRIVLGPRTQHAVYVKVTKAQFTVAQGHQQREPVPYPVPAKQVVYWHFQDRVYSDADGLDANKIKALVLTQRDQRKRTAERAEHLMAIPQSRGPSARQRISPEVRNFVLTRDGNRCVNCDSAHELQLDHMIPVSLGGSSEPENLEVLCGPCNRRKGGSLG